MGIHTTQSWETDDCPSPAGKVGEGLKQEAADAWKIGRIQIVEEVVEEGEKSSQAQAGVSHDQEGEDWDWSKHLCVMFINCPQYAARLLVWVNQKPPQAPGSPVHVLVWALLTLPPWQPSLQTQYLSKFKLKEPMIIKRLESNLEFPACFVEEMGGMGLSCTLQHK